MTPSNPLLTSRELVVHQLLATSFLVFDDRARQFLRQFDLTLQQFGVLTNLTTDQPLSINELSRRILCDKSAMTRIVDRLEERGLVQRVRAGSRDRRLVTVHLTAEGALARSRVAAAYAEFVASLYAGLTSAELGTLQQLLDRLCLSAGRDSSSGTRPDHDAGGEQAARG